MHRRRQPYKKRKRVSTEAFADKLRANMTRCEHLLWERLKRAAYAEFEPQQVVCGYIPDFYCAEARVAIEVDGGVHLRPRVKRRDKHKDTVLASHGVLVIRLTNEMVQYRVYRALTIIRNAVLQRLGQLRRASDRVG
jgi:very-short-patch-repair endonuclease